VSKGHYAPSNITQIYESYRTNDLREIAVTKYNYTTQVVFKAGLTVKCITNIDKDDPVFMNQWLAA